VKSKRSRGKEVICTAKCETGMMIDYPWTDNEAPSAGRPRQGDVLFGPISRTTDAFWGLRIRRSGLLRYGSDQNQSSSQRVKLRER
jgi:hypothetical protein